MPGLRANKAAYFEKLRELLESHKSVFIVKIDNVSSQQMHEIRKSLRGEATVLMGKNTMVRRAIRGFVNEFPDYERLMPYVKGNIGFVFTNADLKDIRAKILANKVAAPARPGAFAPLDVWLKAGNTGFEPSKTAFFQALQVPTKIARGTIEITADVHLVKANTKVGASEATLLNMLGISPFTYGMGVLQVYEEGQVFSPDVLDIEDSTLIAHLMGAIRTITALSLQVEYPTLPSVGHSLINSYKNLLAVSIATDYTFEGSEAVKDRLANPEAYSASAAAPAAAAGGAEPAAAEEKKEEAAEEEEDEDMGFGLFD